MHSSYCYNAINQSFERLNHRSKNTISARERSNCFRADDVFGEVAGVEVGNPGVVRNLMHLKISISMQEADKSWPRIGDREGRGPSCS